MQLAERLRSEGARLQAVRSLPYEPWIVLGPLLLLQWIELAAFAHRIGHSGWVWGDQTAAAPFLAAAHVIAGGHVPASHAGFVLPYLLSPLSLVFGSGSSGVAAGAVLWQALVLTPLALVCVYQVAATIGGRLAGYWTAALWVVSPLLARVLFDPRYHQILDYLV